MPKLTNFEKHLQEEMKNKEFRKAYYKEGELRIKNLEFRNVKISESVRGQVGQVT